MEIQRHNRLKAANERVQSVVHLDSAEREQARTQFNISTVSRWMTNRSALWDACQSKKVQPSVEPLGFAACQSKNSTRSHATSMWM